MQTQVMGGGHVVHGRMKWVGGPATKLHGDGALDGESSRSSVNLGSGGMRREGEAWPLTGSMNAVVHVPWFSIDDHHALVWEHLQL